MTARIFRFLTTEHGLIGASLVRITVAAAILFYLLSNYTDRHLLWGTHGIWPYDDFLRYLRERHTFSLYQLSADRIYFEWVYHVTILVSLAYLIGYRTRITGVLLAVLYWSLFIRNPYITNGGDNVLRLDLFYLMLANTGAWFSWDARRRRKRLDQTTCSLPRQMFAVLHNAAVLAVMIQLAMVYFTSGMYKVMGSMWQHGTAIYYATRVNEFYWPGYSEWIWKYDIVVVLLSYSTVLFQVAFPFLLLNRYTKYAAVAFAISMHIGIALFMGLIEFSWVMIGSEMIFLTDSDFRRIGSAIVQGGSYMQQVWLRITRWIGERKWVQRHRVTVFYDGWCPFCRQSVTTARKLDWFSLLTFVSFREPGVIERYGLSAEKVEKRLHSTADGRHFRDGIDGIIQMSSRLPLLWPLVPLMWIARRIGMGQKVYDFIASRRTVIPAGGCDDACPVNPAQKETASTGEETESPGKG
ncbi:DUF393 domain-containing protein [Polycladomyces sp. WAk]|uniref:DUF393 domain-containing protein n=1 Tax=Polycladomyces zharkentensis TaxID=2807616 RepID=A0ABS2WLM1_9BACL|nr:DCC1-like thiol-disulfide oxidoreductase family protein [Polycladomyces sp. WAk]MBN2910419.1 DUF393 domain-containing protein [Polycladomyces sp. WAk]